MRCRDKNHNFDRRKMSEQDICRLQQNCAGHIAKPKHSRSTLMVRHMSEKKGLKPLLAHIQSATKSLHLSDTISV